MADNSMRFDLGRLWTARDENGSSITLGAFAGRTSITVFRKGMNEPDIKVNIPTSFQLRWRAILKEIIQANPGTKIPFIQHVYDMTTKSMVKNLTMTFIKNEKNVIQVEVSTPKSSQYRFTIRSNGMYSDGNPIAEDQRSVQGAQELMAILDKKVPYAECLTTFNMPPFNRNDRGGNGGGYGNSQNRPHQTGEGFRKQQTSNDPFAGGTDDGDIF
ncbi:MAG: hypothetical protein SOV61_14630 [Lachnospiraceae bacterium]|nr:hypothetical protein [Lachnospiraceae bacterium]